MTEEPITEFKGEFRFLSNFYGHKIKWGKLRKSDGDIVDMYWPTAEHIFQAMKGSNNEQQMYVYQASTPAAAKRRGRHLKLPLNWEESKVQVMAGVLAAKFSDPEMRQKLLDTGDRELIEGNTWGDTFWGVCAGKGENVLGKLLMKLREELRGEAS